MGCRLRSVGLSSGPPVRRFGADSLGISGMPAGTIDRMSDDVPSDQSALSPGRRVKVVRDPEWPGPWPAEPLGVIEPIMGEPYQTIDLRISAINVPSSDRRIMREYLVQFDEPQRDTDGDGPYSAAVI